LGKLGAALLGEEGGGGDRYFAAAREVGIAEEALSIWHLAFSL
jgi:hypothetical protein